AEDCPGARAAPTLTMQIEVRTRTAYRMICMRSTSLSRSTCRYPRAPRSGICAPEEPNLQWRVSCCGQQVHMYTDQIAKANGRTSNSFYYSSSTFWSVVARGYRRLLFRFSHCPPAKVRNAV